jgi:hypothetical protein
VENPHDIIPMDEAFVRIKLSGDYIVLNDPEMIRHAKDALFEDIHNAVKHDEVADWLEVVPAPEGTLDRIPEFLLEEMEEE